MPTLGVAWGLSPADGTLNASSLPPRKPQQATFPPPETPASALSNLPISAQANFNSSLKQFFGQTSPEAP